MFFVSDIFYKLSVKVLFFELTKNTYKQIQNWLLVFLNQLSIFRPLCTPHSGRLLDTAAAAAGHYGRKCQILSRNFVLGNVKTKTNFLPNVIGLVISCSSRSEQTFNFWVSGQSTVFFPKNKELCLYVFPNLVNTIFSQNQMQR